MLVKKTCKKKIVYIILFLLGISDSIYAGVFLPEKKNQKKATESSNIRTDSSQKEILFISSYSENFPPVDFQKSGIYEVFGKNHSCLDIAYMDTAHYNTAKNEILFFEQMQYKISMHRKYDAVLLGDDAALQFAEKYQNDLFKKIPLVFFCVNDRDYAQKAGKNPYITGIIEEINLKDTVDIAARFQPYAGNIIALYDNTLTGIGDQKQFFALRNSYPKYNFSGINSSDYTHKEFARKLESIPEDSIVIYMDSAEDSEHNSYSVSQSVQYITTHCPVPVYSSAFKGMGNGLIGGKLFSFQAAGHTAALLVNAILNGTQVADIPVGTKDESLYCFDYKVLKKYNIRMSLVPRDAYILNKQPRFIDQYETVLIPGIAILSALLLFLLIVLIENVRMKRLTYTLQSYNLQLKEKEEQIIYQTRHDYLTGLSNRRDAMENLSKLIEERQAVTVMLMDIDDFKEINDSEGHLCGDAILAEVGRRFCELTQNTDFYASRSGGDEFLLITKKTEPAQINDLLDKIKKLFEQSIVYNGKEHYLKISIGIVSSKNRTTKASELIGNADLAMFSAKKSGKNGYVYYDAVMTADFVQKKKIEAALSEACRNDGFTVLYQPQIDLSTGATNCFEALVRFKDNSLLPGQFIPVAEETDLILAVGRIVTEKVIAQMVEWRNKGLTLRPVSINFSSKQIRDKEYVNYLKGLLDLYNIPASLIEIEITESILLAHNENAMKLFADFAAIGVKLALDDFGTGYSSINYLTYIPVKKMKLDKSFIDTYLHDGKDAVIDNIIRLSHCLGLKITVEGIEKKSQYDRLKDFSCDYIQGYYLSKPVTGNEIERPEYTYK
jgi:diguanylate cyclase (GGDEF)-like protein